MSAVRPLYENTATKDAERIVAEKIAKRRNLTVHKLPIQYRIDFALVSQPKREVVRFLEVKCRTNLRAKYDTYLLSLLKYTSALHLTRDTGVPVLLAVQWADALGIWQVAQIDRPEVVMGGRSDRADWQDQEPVVMIPVSMFKILEEK